MKYLIGMWNCVYMNFKFIQNLLLFGVINITRIGMVIVVNIVSL